METSGQWGGNTIYTGRRVSKAIINERGTITRVSSQLFLSKVKGNRSPDTIKLFVLAVSTSRSNDEFFNKATVSRANLFKSFSQDGTRGFDSRRMKGEGKVLEFFCRLI